MEKKGTVTQLSSMFPAEETQKASRRVQDAITERQQQLNQVKGFINDNVSLINLIQKLPDETHHNIMVPFGKAAFFPGQLIHTNEFMVLLGEGYYAERTSKQTAEILKRRGKALDTQVKSLKAIMQDLKAEASFFDSTANESAEGLVEIREDYVEEGEGSSGTLPTAVPGHGKSDSTTFVEGDREAAIEDEEYAHIFSRIAELEKEEEEAEKSDESDEDAQILNESDSTIRQISSDLEVRSLPVEALEVPAPKEVSSHGDYLATNNSKINMPLELPQEKKKVEGLPTNNSTIDMPLEPRQEKKEVQAPLTANNTAFTGSIVEHAHNIGRNLPGQQSGASSSKPLSRFKMQRK